MGEEEKVADEAGSRMLIEVGSQAAAVATAMFAGNRGGLPAPVRGALASARAVTFAVSGFARLLAGSPALGAGVLAVLAALIVWAFAAPNALLGALLPALVALGIALGYIVLNFATTAFEPDLKWGRRLVGFTLLLGLPVLALVAADRDWFGIDEWSNGFAAAFALGAAVLALARLVLDVWGRPRWRRTVLGLYRLAVVGALIAFGVGLAIQPLLEEPEPKETCDPADPCGGIDWTSVSDERAGLLLFTVLLATALVTVILVETVVPWWKYGSDWQQRRRSERRAREALRRSSSRPPR
jgi:hypothetical protein